MVYFKNFNHLIFTDLLTTVYIQLKHVFRLICSPIVPKHFTFHEADIFEEVEPGFASLGLKAQCIGGGRLKHDDRAKTINVYGYSSVSLNVCWSVQQVYVTAWVNDVNIKPQTSPSHYRLSIHVLE